MPPGRRELYARCRSLGIRRDDIAAEASCSRPHVTHFFAGRNSSSRLAAAIARLIEERVPSERGARVRARWPSSAGLRTSSPGGSKGIMALFRASYAERFPRDRSGSKSSKRFRSTGWPRRTSRQSPGEAGKRRRARHTGSSRGWAKSPAHEGPPAGPAPRPARRARAVADVRMADVEGEADERE